MDFELSEEQEELRAGARSFLEQACPPSFVRKVFGSADALQKPGSIWRMGADQATFLHTDADLDINGLAVPKGEYTLFADLDEGKWQLIVSKQTGQWGIKRTGEGNVDPAQVLVGNSSFNTGSSISAGLPVYARNQIKAVATILERQ